MRLATGAGSLGNCARIVWVLRSDIHRTMEWPEKYIAVEEPIRWPTAFSNETG
jgi:hypothetical protein